MSKQRSVLVVEDSSTMRQLLTLALRRIPGLTISEATNGAEALKTLATKTFDLVLLDLNMPVMGGFTFLEHLQNLPIRPPVIVITTEGALVDRERAASLGVVAYVTKPVRGPDLSATVLTVLGQ